MRRFTIRILMAVIVVSAVGLAALRNASELWAGMMLLVALAAIGISLLGILILRGQEQAWSVGFALFAGIYFALALAPWLSEAFWPNLGTTHILIAAHEYSTANFDAFQRAGHSLFALLSGLAGGTVASWFYSRRECS